MSQNKTAEIYKELEPVIQELEKSEFMSKDLTGEVDIPKRVIGEELSKAARESKYEIEIVDKWPYRFSNPYFEGSESTSLEDIENEEDRYILGRTLQILEAEKEYSSSGIDQNEAQSIFNHFLDYDDFVASQEKAAKLEEKFEELDEVQSKLENPSNKLYYPNEE
jgi:predicted glycosyltransferase